MDNTPLRILLADDDESDRFLFKEVLEELKVKTTVHTVNDGVYLMDYLSQEDTPLPHLIFLDLNMPRKNGLECLKEIRKDERLNAISIVIYSTSSAEKDIEEAFLSGANVYIKKPNEYNLLKQTLNKVVVTAFQFQYPPFDRANFLLRI